MINWERVLVVGFVVLAALAVATLLVFRHKHPAPPPPLHALVQNIPAPVIRTAPAVQKPVHVQKPIYHRVLPSGKIDGRIDCKYVRSMTNSYSDVQTYGASYAGLSPATIARLRVCFP